MRERIARDVDAVSQLQMAARRVTIRAPRASASTGSFFAGFYRIDEMQGISRAML
jgi:hypothetical protein